MMLKAMAKADSRGSVLKGSMDGASHKGMRSSSDRLKKPF
jgi:hypothetical protein